MSIQFNAASIFEIGIQIEKNGRDFYLEVSRGVSDSAVKALFGELADWESRHIEIFEKMKAELPGREKEDTIFDPGDELYGYLEAAADSHVFADSKEMTRRTSGLSSPSAALELALTFEKDSVVYYTTMKKAVAGPLGREKIDALIDEELKHIAILNKKKKELEAGKS